MLEKLSALALLLIITGCKVFCGGSLEGWCDGACPTFDPYDYDQDFYQPMLCGDHVQMLYKDLYGEDLYFDAESYELVAVREFSDIEEYCGKFSAWHGPRIECEATCVFAEEAQLHYYTGEEIPPC